MGCPSKLAKDEHDGPFTADEAARERGVTMSTLHRWLREGILAGRQATPGASRLVCPTGLYEGLAENFLAVIRTEGRGRPYGTTGPDRGIGAVMHNP